MIILSATSRNAALNVGAIRLLVDWPHAPRLVVVVLKADLWTKSVQRSEGICHRDITLQTAAVWAVRGLWKGGEGCTSPVIF
jgi:hypothetical protein